ncbi:hypothetical protein [Salipiger abyssi]|uniref:hypothetical protein n=1 Tax=Salipiger abyssi TaxID=1250539 RepID=UPI001A8F2F1A|nr:hypothetical protein [Salipiger abyssi]MBN9890150.1 hypothetical protein [Salipiger abyssi]
MPENMPIFYHPYLTASNIIDLVHLAGAAYENAYSGEVSGWDSITTELLSYGLPEVYIPGHYAGLDSYYAETNEDADGFTAVARATVYLNNDENAIVVAFRGTEDESYDFLDWVEIERHANAFSPLIDAVKEYALKNGVSKIWLTGHSLGGGAAEIIIGENEGDELNGLSFSALTIASPIAGYDEKDDRVLNFGHESDVVYGAWRADFKGDNSVSNVYIAFDDSDWWKDGYLNLLDYKRQHDISWAYPHSTETILNSQFYEEISRGTKVIVSATNDYMNIFELAREFIGSKSAVILGLDQVEINVFNSGSLLSPNDILIGGGANDTLEGFSGNDIFIGDAALFGGGGDDVYAGGAGADVFVGTLLELDGDRVVDLDASDRFFVENVSLSQSEVSVSEGLLNIRYGDANFHIYLDVPDEYYPVTSPGVDLNGEAGTWITFSKPSHVLSASGSISSVDVSIFQGPSYRDREEAESLPILNTSVAAGGGYAYSSVNFFTGSISVDLQSSEWLPQGVMARSHAMAFFGDVLFFENPNLEEGEIWSVTVTYDSHFNYEAYPGLSRVIASFGSARFSTGLHQGLYAYQDFFGTRVSYRDISGNGLTDEAEVGIYTLEYQFDEPFEEVDVSLEASLYAWNVLEERMSIQAGATISISGLPVGASFTSASGYFLYAGLPHAEFDTYSIPKVLALDEQSIEEAGTLEGGPYNSSLQGSSGNDVMTDLGGNNELDGGGGSDLLQTGEGNDVQYGGDGNDTLNGGGGDDHLLGGDDDDEISAGSGSDYSNGGSGSDQIYYEQGADLIIGGQGGDSVTLSGSDLHGSGIYALNVSSDIQVGTGVSIPLEGLVKNEAIVDGGVDFDIILLGDTNDAFFLHDAYSSFHGSVLLEADYAGNQSAARFSEIEAIYAMSGNDIIDLTSPDYSLKGDRILINGGAGDDVIWGSDADETILGGDGSDTIFGGVGDDVLTGGLGADVFEFTCTSTNSTITDFSVSEGDMLIFYNSEGVTFDPDSAQVTQNAFLISYTEASTGNVHEILVEHDISTYDYVHVNADILNYFQVI